jgi:hypothetical protein
MTTRSEKLLAAINDNIFYSEFCFFYLEVRDGSGQSRQLADHIVALDDLLMLFQVKERAEPGTPEDERAWFYRKVVKKASRQMRDTLGLLESGSGYDLPNHRGQIANVSIAKATTIHKVIVYAASADLPQDCADVRHHFSTSGGGFIHILSAIDYLSALRFLLAPGEFAAYLAFRESVVRRWEAELVLPSERSLVAQFMSGDLCGRPCELPAIRDEMPGEPAEAVAFIRYLGALGRRFAAYSDAEEQEGFRRVLAEIARLDRRELIDVAHGVALCVDAVKSGRIDTLPWTMQPSSRPCGFVFVPVFSRTYEDRLKTLGGFACADKYRYRHAREIGIAVAIRGSDVELDTCLIDCPPVYDERAEALLKQTPFREHALIRRLRRPLPNQAR